MAVIAPFLGAFVAAWWAVSLERRALRVFRPVYVGSGSEMAATGLTPEVPEARSTGRRPTCGVLGWRYFELTSVLVLDDRVLLGCREVGADESSNTTQTLLDTQTMVLLIGDDERSPRAVALLEAWSRRGIRLSARPTAVAGAIELRDDGASILRAPLLAA